MHPVTLLRLKGLPVLTTAEQDIKLAPVREAFLLRMVARPIMQPHVLQSAKLLTRIIAVTGRRYKHLMDVRLIFLTAPANARKHIVITAGTGALLSAAVRLMQAVLTSPIVRLKFKAGAATPVM